MDAWQLQAGWGGEGPVLGDAIMVLPSVPFLQGSTWPGAWRRMLRESRGGGCGGVMGEGHGRTWGDVGEDISGGRWGSSQTKEAVVRIP